MMSASLALLLLSGIIGLTFAQNVDECASKDSCSACISTPSCTWCSAAGQAQCFSDSTQVICSQEDLLQPLTQVLHANVLPLNEENQISLQDISVKLRVGEPLEFTVSVKAATDFPLDVYMLMDLSFSFLNDLETVKAIAPQLPLSLRNVSSDFVIGFGSFVDKPILPFTSNAQIREIFQGGTSACVGALCAKPFAYEHVVDLTNSSELFNSLVRETVISTNVDNPEGALDGILQAVICEDIVGWRENSRKILLVMTDDALHTAGDGALAGIVKPNDGLCHTAYDPLLNKTLYGQAALLQDYPSFQQVKQALQDRNIVPIFAIPSSVSQNLKTFYEDTISELFGGFSSILSENSDNLLQVLQDAYSNVVSNARLSFVIPDYLSVNITANCPENSTYLPDIYECTNISTGTVDFTISLALTQCASQLQNDSVETITFNIPGFGAFYVDVGTYCSCDCDNETSYASPLCSNNGDFTCGLCDCDEGWSGPVCDCSTAECPVGPNRQECSGSQRGQCQCGQCVCNQPSGTIKGVANPRIEGDACECSNYECDIDSDGVVCSGRGTCTCTNGTFTCQCDVSPITGIRYTGDTCQCSFDQCLNTTISMEVCNGRGTCNSCQSQGSACTCDPGFIGSLCELAYSGAPSCSLGNTDCISCYAKAAKNGNDPETSCSHLSCVNFNTLSSSQEVPASDVIEGSTRDCSFSTVECSYTYTVAVSLNSTVVYYVEPEACLLIPIWAIALIIVIGLIIIGIAVLVIIKLIVMYRDYREYKMFVYEVKQSEQTRQENPVYLNPITQTVNPVHGKAL